jgi:hypothetical protein
MLARDAYAETDVRDQLDRILTSAPFRNSRRASALLRYTVERALAGDIGALKERTIGVEVFGRAAGYDTSTDHIVRSTAGDVRRRLAQYYQENGSGADALRIELEPGSYVPRFGSAASAASAHSALARFWAPIVERGRPVLLCIGGPGLAPVLGESAPPKRKSQVTLGEAFALESEKVAFSDAVTLAAIVGYLASHGVSYRIAHETDVGLDDLRHGPSVLIGALNNDWGLRLADQLRFTFAFDAEARTASILDRGKPAWTVHLDVPFTSVCEDRGIIARVMNRTTGEPMILAAGVTMLGTLAAGELLTNPECMPDGSWDRPNAQVLFSTKVLRGSATSPRVLETCFW